MNPSNKSLEEILSKASSIIEEVGGQPSPETAAIRHLLVTPDQVRAFHRQDLYLALIKKLVRERFNVSFPEDPAIYSVYVTDCVRLACQMEKERKPFDQEEWLNYALRFFENLKTPYYRIYVDAVLTLRQCFSDSGKASQAISDVYAQLIKAAPDKLDLIHAIILHIPSYTKGSGIDEGLLNGILRDALALFCLDKNYWITSVTSLLYGVTTRSPEEIHAGRLLADYLKKEDTFIHEVNPGKCSLPDYIAKRTLWFADHQELPSDDIIFSLQRSGASAPPAVDFLNKYAYNMNTASYVTDPAIGRESEIRDLELILISPKKSPLVIGEAGVGKTAVVEGLAYRLAKGDVPDLLKDRVLYKLTTTSLLGGAKYVGEMEERIRTLTDELYHHPEVILFIDEIHTIVGAGSTESSNNDISNMLKPFIDRGDIKIIGATTRDEYERFLVPDRALARRFYPIAVEEPEEDLCLKILLGTRPAIEYRTKVRCRFAPDLEEAYLRALIRMSIPENQPDQQRTRLPELPLSILEMAFSYAALDNRSVISKEDLASAVSHSNRLSRQGRENGLSLLNAIK